MLIAIVIWALCINWIAQQRGYYSLPKVKTLAHPKVSFGQLIGSFALYVFLAFVVAKGVVALVSSNYLRSQPDATSLPVPYLIWIQTFIMLAIFVSVLLLSFCLDRTGFFRLWKEQNWPHRWTSLGDFGLGVLTWAIAFPLVLILSELSDYIMGRLLGPVTYEQSAVFFFKTAMQNPFSLFAAILTVVFLAPLIEEFLFRGILQTFCRKFLGSKASILLSALVFACFHYSATQGLGNVTLILSFTLLGCFLGFLYERQGSLWAPIGLHFTFNAISALRILFSMESL